jgi:hypothetical protein
LLFFSRSLWIILKSITFLVTPINSRCMPCTKRRYFITDNCYIVIFIWDNPFKILKNVSRIGKLFCFLKYLEQLSKFWFWHINLKWMLYTSEHSFLVYTSLLIIPKKVSFHALKFYIYIYIYIYMCVCVCVCVCIQLRWGLFHWFCWRLGIHW